MDFRADGAIRLSTHQFAERDQAEVTREIFGRVIMKIDLEPLPDIPFHMDMVLRELPDIGLAHGTCSPKNCSTTAQLIDSDDLILTVAMSGDGVFYAHGREAEIGGGSATLIRSADPLHFDIRSDAELLSIRLPFNKIAPLVADVDAVLARTIPESTEALRLLVHYASALRDADELATPEVRSLVATHLQDLAALAIGATRDSAELAGRRGLRAARLRAIKADIIENLADRQLSIDLIAVRHGITPRHLSRLFESAATTFSEFVLTQRLNQAHRMLIAVAFSGRTVSSIAYEAGFGDISYFNRAFRRVYGATPSEVREARRSS